MYDLLYEIFLDMELPILELLEPATLKTAIVRAMQQDFYRFSYRNGLVFEEDGGKYSDAVLATKGNGKRQSMVPCMLSSVRWASRPTQTLFPRYRKPLPGEWYLD